MFKLRGRFGLALGKVKMEIIIILDLRAQIWHIGPPTFHSEGIHGDCHC